MFTLTLGTKLFIVYLMYLLKTYIPMLFSKKQRELQQSKNLKLEELRSIKNKTLEQQKEFIDFKYPKTDPFKWSFSNIIKIIIKIIFFVGIYMLVRYTWANYLGFNIKIWQLMLIMLFLPIIINNILKKMNLQQDDVRVFLN